MYFFCQARPNHAPKILGVQGVTLPKHVKVHAPGVQFSTPRACCTTLLCESPVVRDKKFRLGHEPGVSEHCAGRGCRHMQMADTPNLVPCGRSGSDAVGEPAPSVPSLYRHDVRDAGHEGLGRSCPQQETSVNALSGALFLVLQSVSPSRPRATQRQMWPFLTTKKMVRWSIDLL